MFIIKQSGTFFWPVKFKLASAEKAGSFETHTFDAEFKRVSADRLRELQAQVLETGDVKPVIRDVMPGWRGVVGDDKQEVQFSEHMLDELLVYPEVQAAIMEAFMEANSGDKARRKN